MAFGILVVLLIVLVTTTAPAAQPLSSNCNSSCGDLTFVPYPFGIGEDCYFNPKFLITCNYSTKPPKAFLMESNLNVKSISLDGEMVIEHFVSRDCYNNKAERVERRMPRLWLQNYTASSTSNKFVGIGCDTRALVEGYRGEDRYATGCISSCDSLNVFNESCSGVGCCQISIPRGLQNFTIKLTSYYNHSGILDDSNPCNYAFVVKENEFNFSLESFKALENKTIEMLPMVLNWAIGNEDQVESCEAAKKRVDYACKGRYSDCVEVKDGSAGYHCRCLTGFQGNPYILDGCQDIDECKNNLTLCKPGNCLNLPGNWTCKCPKRYNNTGTGCTLNNAGYQSEKLVIFCIALEELKRATNNYDEDRVLGEGGFGKVYKGILPNNEAVAIKKSKIGDETQTAQFINEIIMLLQINHRNVVKLLGCCLETEVPLLVYKFISNGTLFHHIHNTRRTSVLAWKLRLKIATETAQALAYLHSATSTPIIHRDVKSTNILLDDNYVANVSDFGASRLIPIDKNQLTTMVQGTLGYLDPEYFHSSQLTEKSDVYSFGVVLAELLTIEQNCLFDVVDGDIVDEENVVELKQVANLAKRCLSVKGTKDPP
ncbi:hypothetical protein FNV43_RR06342 [Rhamnella rubrinervis]|uniref:Protein kinase domain-containing protein n=1 Tax=Rhamnella rubrinervis TaxID=2594499 RepID=A0A8K0MLD6_9ROSA|nr:hypothetical protein FNV43_RR06342 [Rhamnella rubrinervis]